MFTAAKVLHDSVNSLTFQDEIRQISNLISTFITKVEFGKEVIKHLDFYVECRRAFANLDGVKSNLVQGVCSLAMRTLSLVRGRHTKKTSAFVRACVAYCFITIPSMDDVFGQLHLYLLSGIVALANQSLPQADSLFKAAITLLQEVPPQSEIDCSVRSNEDWLLSYIAYFASVLVIAPGHPEQGPFYLVKGLLKVVQDYPWEPTSNARALAFLSILSLFAAQYQPSLPYHIPKVDSNDVLYGGDEEFKKELQAIIDRLLELILEQMATLKKDSSPSSERKQKILACALLEHTVRLAALNAKSATLAANLFQLAKKSGATSAELRACIAPLKYAGASTGADPTYQKLCQELYVKLSQTA
jgi:hypothetical protein